MSAIAGLLQFDGGTAIPSAAIVQRLAGIADAVWTDGAVCLADARRHAGLAITWDGRLDNRDELARELETAALPDAELVLLGYRRWGTQMPAHLLGDFAFAIWDAHSGSLFCVRDPLGARPFFFVRTGNLFAFASQDDPLAALPGVSPALNEERIANFLLPAFTGFDATRSWLRDVRAVGPGEWLLVSRDGRERRTTYWRPEAQAEARFASEQECAEAFRELFTEAVRARLPPEGDAALMLSGGLDSAAILASADALGFDRLHTYSGVSDEAIPCIESDCIRDLTRSRGERAHFLHVPSFTGIAGAGDVADLAWSQPHPIDHSLLLPAVLCRAASRDGHRVMLTGVCGDLTTHGTHAYIGTLLAQSRWRDAWRESRAASRNHTYLQQRAPAAILARHVADRLKPAPLRTAVRAWRAHRRAYLADSVIDAQFAARVGALRWLVARRDRAGESHQQAHIAALLPPYGIASSLGGYNRVAARFGIEIRDPWADRRVVEFWLRLPLAYKFQGGWTKYLLRRAFEGALPPSVVQRVGKQHVGWNLMARVMDDSREHARQLLVRDLGCVDNFVDTHAARELYRRYLQSGQHRDREKVFDLLTLIAWVRHCENTR